jgi:hypothetical protein
MGGLKGASCCGDHPPRPRHQMPSPYPDPGVRAPPELPARVTNDRDGAWTPYPPSAEGAMRAGECIDEVTWSNPCCATDHGLTGFGPLGVPCNKGNSCSRHCQNHSPHRAEGGKEANDWASVANRPYEGPCSGQSEVRHATWVTPCQDQHQYCGLRRARARGCGRACRDRHCRDIRHRRRGRHCECSDPTTFTLPQCVYNVTGRSNPRSVPS